MTSAPITDLLRLWNNGDRHSFDAVVTAMLPQLRLIAHRIGSRRCCNTLQTTALANELYIRFAQSCPGAKNRQHLLALAATTMQHLLVDHARARLREKRGGGAQIVPLDEASALNDRQLERVVAIDTALATLEAGNARQALVFRMRFFGGFAVPEVAEALAVSHNTIIRDWSAACAFLREHLVGRDAGA
jgi:RNA polymerase sigma factor (TIGR02999 family)